LQQIFSGQLKQKKSSVEKISKVKKEAGQAHYEVGSKVRQTIADLGGTMPEDLPTPEKSIKQIVKRAEIFDR